MGTGGIKATNIVQSVSFFNTTGIIEKEHNLYFAPKNRTGTDVNLLWLEDFLATVPATLNNYRDITISQWSPEDRRLTIIGRIEDFRSSTGGVLNYAIIHQVITGDSLPRDFYYAYFVTGVTQTGVNSLVIDLEPDNFTNFFFLQNTDGSYPTYDKFNKSIKNAYVERQHYDRVTRGQQVQARSIEKVFNPNLECPFMSMFGDTWAWDGEPEPTGTGEFYGWQYITPCSFRVYLKVVFPDLSENDLRHITSVHGLYGRFILKGNLVRYDGTEDDSIDFYPNNGNPYFEIIDFTMYRDVVSSSLDPLDEEAIIDIYETDDTFIIEKFTIDIESYYEIGNMVNLPLFSNYDESFVYRRQVRDSHKLLNYGDPKDKEELINEIGDATRWSDLSDYTRIKIAEYCLAFATVTFKGADCLIGNVNSHVSTQPPSSNAEIVSKVLPRIKPSVRDNLVTMTFPVPIIPDFLNKFNSDINKAFSYFRLKGNNSYYIKNNFSKILETSIFSEYIVSVSITKEHKLKDFLEFKPAVLEGGQRYFIPSIDYSFSYDNDLPQLAMFYAGKDANFTYAGHDINVVQVVNNRWIGYYLRQDLDTVIYLTNKFIVDNGSGSASDYNTIEIALNINMNNLAFIYGFVVSPLGGEYSLSLDYTAKDTTIYYYEPLLEFNPYAFYSVSYLGRLETPLNLRNYYENFNQEANRFDIKFFLSVSVNDTTKYTFIPIYKITGTDLYYYSEALEVTLPNQLTILSDVMLNYIVQNTAQMKNQFAVNNMNLGKGMVTGALGGIAGGVKAGVTTGNPLIGAGMGAVQGGVSMINSAVTWAYNKEEIAMNQKAKLADLGNVPDNVKQVGTDITSDLAVGEMGLYLNHYRIDEISYNNIAKYLERYGYQINIYDTLNAYNRKGWNYIKLVDCEFDEYMTAEQEESIRQILKDGVTLLHEPSYLHDNSKHNYEIILD